MAEELDQKLHIFFFPMLAQGHMLPMLDMANVFSSRGHKSTLITSHHFVPMFEKAIQRIRDSGFDISVRPVHFPRAESGLPEGAESVEHVKSMEHIPKFLAAIATFQGPLESLLQEFRPDCIVADTFYPWSNDLAAKYGIPRLFFNGNGTFANTLAEVLRFQRPYDSVSSDNEPFLVPDIPHQIMLTKGQVPLHDRENKETETGTTRLVREGLESNAKSFGVLVNSFYELEPDYAEYYVKKLERRAWHVGPLFLYNKEVEERAQRGKESGADERDWLKWLDSRKPKSVVYVCFGSRANFTAAQLHEIANGLEISCKDFIWVVRDCADEEDAEKWFPTGFLDRTKEKGLTVLKGWVPQLFILGHESVGAFISHCGWNSVLEGVGSGVPLVTWPLFAEQFLNEKLLVEVLGIGASVGAKQCSRVATGDVKAAAVAAALELVMGGGDGVEIRRRCEAMKITAGKAVEEGGSSYNALDDFVREVKAFHSGRNQN